MTGDGAPAVALRETCRLVCGAVPLWPYHRARLESGGCGPDVLSAADAVVEREAQAWTGPDSSRLRLTVVVDGGGAADARVQRRLSSLDVPGGPIAVPVEVDAPPGLPLHAAKPADRSWWDAAQRRARSAGGDQAIVTLGGRILDGGTATVWLVIDGALCTPAAPDAVAGVARAFVLERCSAVGLPVRVGDLTLTDLMRADEVLLTNAFAGAVAVRGRGGPHCERVREEFARIWSS